MRITIITVSYNVERTIVRTIESVLEQQTEHEIDYIVVDGGSRDGTVDILKGYERSGRFADNKTFRWLSEKDEGMYDAINKGVALAKGEIIGILNADDRFEDVRVVEDVVKSFADGIDCIYGDIRFVRGDSDQTARYYSSRPWKRWMHNWGYMPAHPTVYVRKDVFDRFGPYKLGYDISADFEWMVRILCRERIKAKYVPRCMVTMTLGGKSTAGLRAMIKLNRENVRANRENGYFCCLPMMLPKYAYKALGYIFRRA